MRNNLGEHAVSACEHLSQTPNLTNLYLANNNLGEYAVLACEHLRKLPHLTELDLQDNDLGKHAVDICRSFLTPNAAITLTFSNHELSVDIKTQCLYIEQENLDLRKEDTGVVWLNGFFRKKETETRSKTDGTGIEHQTEEPIVQESTCKKSATNSTVNLFDIPDSIIPHVFNYAYVGVAPLHIDIR